jgi:iron complex transport system substrate-binding protein
MKSDMSFSTSDPIGLAMQAPATECVSGNGMRRSTSAERQRVRIIAFGAIYALAVAFLWMNILGTSARAEDRRLRIVSINACADQLLYALAEPEQIAALTHYAVQDDYSIYVDEIRRSGIKRIQGNAEEVMKLKPDLVLAGTYTRRATRELLARHGVRVELFPPARNIAESREAIRRVAKLTGNPEKGEALIERIDGALKAQVDHPAGAPALLQLQRGGYVSGPETLIGDLLARLGARNAAPGLGVEHLGVTSLERALKLRADGLVLFDPYSNATDQGSAMLLHPALRVIYPPERRIVIPGRLVICGGPSLPEAITELRRQLNGFAARQRAG